VYFRTGFKSMSAAPDETTVLVADDDAQLLGLVARRLKGMGYQVVEAMDGDKAWSAAQKCRPDLVVLDVMMPGMSGWEVCRRIRESEDLSDTRVIMLTGIGARLNEMTSPLYGADDYLDKPFDFDAFDRKVRTVLGREE
jgi:DNA-binding response OmpR family regulator